MLSTQRRFLEAMTQRCTIQRAEVTASSNLDMNIADPETVAENIPCLIVPLDVSDDMRAAGPIPINRFRMFLPAGTDVQNHDVLIDEDTAEEWIVTEPPITQRFRNERAHHIEAIVESPVVT
jgi:hypothetical protein